MTVRYPPKKIRKELRKEVGFGCPVQNCGSPFLTYHHFNPRWCEAKTHDPSNMVALCLPHHKEADYGVFTNEQLYQFKKQPFLKSAEKNPNGKFNWYREILLFYMGSNWFINPTINFFFNQKIILRINGSKGKSSNIDLVIFNNHGKKLFEMKENEWVVIGDISDLECPPSNNSLKLISQLQKFNISIAFENLSAEKLEKKYGTFLSPEILDSIILYASGFNESNYFKNIKPENIDRILEVVEEEKKKFKRVEKITLMSFFYYSEHPKVEINQNSIRNKYNLGLGKDNLIVMKWSNVFGQFFLQS